MQCFLSVELILLSLFRCLFTLTRAMVRVVIKEYTSNCTQGKKTTMKPLAQCTSKFQFSVNFSFFTYMYRDVAKFFQRSSHTMSK